MNQLSPVVIAAGVGLIAVGLRLSTGPVRLDAVLGAQGLMIGGSTGLAGYCGALVL